MATAYRTTETRWFFKDAIPRPVTDWFQSVLPGDTMEVVSESREDLYLLARGRGDLGLKYRQNSLQLKLQNGYHSFSALSDRVAGLVGDWQRFTWAYDRTSVDLAQTAFASPNVGYRVQVRKNRRQRAFQLDPGGQVRPLRVGETPALPLLIEITEVAFDSYSGWTMGLDAVGNPMQAHPGLLRAAEAILETFPLLPLEAGASQSYPDFLLQQCLNRG